MTDSEIVKALECLEKDTNCGDCAFKMQCKGDCVFTKCLDLINRLQADCENYKQVAENQQKATLDKGFEIKRLKDYAITVEKEVDWYRDELRHSDKKVATKAYKEVFEKLNDKSIRSKAKVKGCGFLYVSVVTLHDINTLKKELIGE